MSAAERALGRGGPAAAEQLLSGRNIRATAARVAVLRLLLGSRSPLSPADIIASSAVSGFNRVTIYRTLATLKAAALLHAVQGTDGSWRYAARELPRPGCPGNHPHFLCLACGRMSCLIGQTLPRVRVPAGATVQGKQMVVYGKCAMCKKNVLTGGLSSLKIV